MAQLLRFVADFIKHGFMLLFPERTDTHTISAAV